MGQTVPVLFEEEKEGFWRGYTPQYVEVKVKTDRDLHNQLHAVAVTAAGNNEVFGRLLEEEPT